MNSKALRIVLLVTIPIGTLLAMGGECSAQSGSKEEATWNKVIGLAEAIVGEGGLLDAKGAEEKLDALVDLHIAFCADIMGKDVSSQRVMAVKQGLRLFLKTVSSRYRGDKRKAILRLLRDLAENRAVFVELLTSDSPAEVIEQKMLAYLERNQGMSYKEPVPIKNQVSVPKSGQPLQIVSEGIRLVGDSGTSGHYNKAIDAGEVIKLNIPLKNVSDSPFRSTSGFLQTKDKYVRVGVSEVLYTERSEIDGQTVTFAPGQAITPSQHFVFTVSPKCPDGHTVEFSILAWDSDRGKFSIPFSLAVYHVGPIGFGKALVDDDPPGQSDGDSDGVMEVGETIEYVLRLQNLGPVTIGDVQARLFLDHAKVRFLPDGGLLHYRPIKGGDSRPVPASFVFEIGGEEGDYKDTVRFKLYVTGKARNHQYSWIATRLHRVGLSSGRMAEIATAKLKEIAQLKTWSWREIMSLARQGGDVRVLVNKTGFSILHFAATFGHADDVPYLVRRGARVDAVARDQRTPLVYAILEGHPKVAEALIAAGADVNVRGLGDIPVLTIAAREGLLPVVKALIDAGAKVNAKAGSSHYRAPRGPTALYRAASEGHASIVKLLLESGADPNILCEELLVRDSALLYTAARSRDAKTDAEKEGYVETVRLLIKAGADVNLRSKKELGSTPVSATHDTIIDRNGSLYKPKPHTGASKAVYLLLKKAGAR